MAHAIADAAEEMPGLMPRFFGVFRYSRRAVELVWTTSRWLTFVLAGLTILAGVLPAGIAYVGKLIVDGVVAAIGAADPDTRQVLIYVLIEAGIVALLAACQRGISASESLLRALLGQRVNVMILEKALTLQLRTSKTPNFTTSLLARAAKHPAGR